MNRFLILSVTLLLFLNIDFISAQVVDIERQRQKTAEDGISGGLNLSGSYLDNDEVIYTYTIQSNLQYKIEKNLLLLIGDYKISRSSDTDFQDAAFLHLRYNRNLSEKITFEAFNQIQDDKISLLKYRYLTGAGFRLKIIDTQGVLLNAGVIPMYENEHLINDENTINRDFRISNYLNGLINISGSFKIYNTTYFQPIYDIWSDFRLHNETRIEAPITERINFNVTNTYSWDAAPPVGAPNQKVDLEVGFGFDF